MDFQVYNSFLKLGLLRLGVIPVPHLIISKIPYLKVSAIFIIPEQHRGEQTKNMMSFKEMTVPTKKIYHKSVLIN